MKHPSWAQAACLAALFCLSTTTLLAADPAAPMTTPAVVTVNQDKEDDPAFAVPTVTNPIPATEIESSKIVEANGRWLVSDKALQSYGLHTADAKAGTYWVTVPAAPNQTTYKATRAALQLPGQQAGSSRTINIKHIRKALGIRYELDGDAMTVLPPAEAVQGTPVLLPQEAAPIPQQKKGKMGTVLFWDPVMSETQAMTKLDTHQPVMSPCVFRLTKDGISLRHPDFDMLAETYQNAGYAMWSLVDNQFDPELTHQILAKPALQDKMITELIGYALLYDFKGYNLDFENVRYEDKDKLTAFVKKISDAVHAYGIQLSMDVTPISDSPNWSLVYDREKLAPSLDYMMVMAYDQFGRTSPVAGPVASYPWVEKAVQNMTNIVPSEKILLGMPLYMRIWFEAKNQKELPTKLDEWPAIDTKALAVDTAKGTDTAMEPTDTTSVGNTIPAPWQSAYLPLFPSVRPVALEEGLEALPAAAPAQYAAPKGTQQAKPKLFVRTLTLADSVAIREKYKAYVKWDDTLRLHYLDLPLVTGRVKIWFEDDASLKEKAKLVETYHLGGAAFWRKGFEPADFWQGFAKHELT